MLDHNGSPTRIGGGEPSGGFEEAVVVSASRLRLCLLPFPSVGFPAILRTLRNDSNRSYSRFMLNSVIPGESIGLSSP